MAQPTMNRLPPSLIQMQNKIASKQTPATIAVHQRQVVWQVWLPLGLALLVILLLIIGIIFTAASPAPASLTPLTAWSDVSLIVLVVPVGVASIFLLSILSGMVYLIARLLKLLPPYTQLAQAYVYYTSTLVRYWCDRIVSPVISLRGYWAGVRSAYQSLLNILMP